MKKRTGEPWMPGDAYGRSLPAFTVNLVASNVPRSVEFYRDVLGAELRAFGVDPDAVERRARAYGATIVRPSEDRHHGWREVMVADPDGYVWAVGVAIGS